MSEQTPPEFDFERLMKQNLPDLKIDLGEPQPSLEPIQVPESKSDSPWKKPTAKQKEYFGGLLYNLAMPWPLYIIEDTLSLHEDYEGIKVKGAMIALFLESYQGRAIYLPNGSLGHYTVLNPLAIENLHNNPSTPGLIILRNPNLTLLEYATILSKAIIRTNYYLDFIGNHRLPDYPTA